jgi:hypothetical protein
MVVMAALFSSSVVIAPPEVKVFRLDPWKPRERGSRCLSIAFIPGSTGGARS